MDLLWVRKGFRDIRRNKLKVIPLIVLLIIGTSLSIAWLDSVSSFDNSFNIAWNQHHYHQALVTVKPMSEKELTNYIAETIAKTHITGVNYEERAFIQTSFNNINLDVYAVNGTRDLSVDSLMYASGTPLYESNISNAAVIDQVSAQTNNFSTIQKMDIPTTYGSINVNIVNKAYSPEYLWKASFKTNLLPIFTGVVVWMKLSELLKISNTTNVINQLALYFTNPTKDQQNFLSAFISIAGSSNVLSISGRDPLLSLIGPLYTGLTLFVDLIIYGSSLIITFIVINRFVEEEYPVLGLYKAIGMKNREMITPVLIFSLIIGLIGSVIGVISGLASSGSVLSAISETVVTVPGAGLKFNDLAIFIYFLVPILVTLVATLLASKKILSIDPQLVIRPTSEMSIPKQSILTNIYIKIRKLKVSPFRLYSFRYLSQKKSRVFGVFIGILIATSIIAFSFNFLIAYNNSYSSKFTYDNWDSDITLNSFINQSEVPTTLGLNNFQGNVTYGTQVITSTRFSTDLTNAYPVTGINPNTQFQYFENNKTVSNGQLLVTIDLALHYNLHTGSNVKVISANNTDLTLTIGGILHEGQSRGIFTTEQTARQIAGISNTSLINGIFLNSDQPTTLSNYLQNSKNSHIENIVNLTEIKDQQAQSNQILDFVLYFLVFMGILFGIIITLIIITVTISERKNDFINFRSLGIRNREFFSIIFFELAYSSVLGLVLGLIAGNEIMAITGEYFSSIGFAIGYSPDILAISLTILSVIVTGAIATYISLRSVLKANIAESTLARMLG